MNDTVVIAQEAYATDIKRIVNAFSTEHRGQREKLKDALKAANFVRTIDLGNHRQYISKPADAYLATGRLRELLEGVEGAIVVDDSFDCLRGNDVRDILEQCDASRSLIQTEVPCTLSWEQRQLMRRAAGCENMSSEEQPTDHTLRSLPELLKLLPTLTLEEQRQRAQLLWDALKDVEQRRGSGAFSSTYVWNYFHRRETSFEPAFVRALNETAWVPDGEGNLQQPRFVLFESLGWDTNPFLTSKIRFKPPIVDQLAREAGIETGVLDLLISLGVTSEAELRQRLGVKEDGPTGDEPNDDNLDDALKKLGITDLPTPPARDSMVDNPRPPSESSSGVTSAKALTNGGGKRNIGLPAQQARNLTPDDSSPLGEHDGSASNAKPSSNSGAKPTPGTSGSRPFISYVASHPDDEEADPDDLDHATRMSLEAKAIEAIRAKEPQWRLTPTHNPGFDFYELSPDGRPVRWCEVKAMMGGLADRPVGLSRTQFDRAREHGSDYWLYAVEHAGSDQPRIVRIQDPAGKSRTFTFDRGWLEVTEADSEPEKQKD